MDYKTKKKLDGCPNVAKAFYSDVVGKCVSILKDYMNSEENPTLDGFEWYYIRTKGIAPLVKSINMVISNGYSLELSTEYVRLRVFEQTFKGSEMEIEALKHIRSKGKDCRSANWDEDSAYAVDIIGDSFAIQVKPSTYKGSNPSLDKDKSIHFKKHREYERLTGKNVFYMFYDKNNNFEEIIKYRDEL